MKKITFLYNRKVRSMSDEELFRECERLGNIMAITPMKKEDKIRAFHAFTEASRRDSMVDDKEMFLTALRVLRII